MIQVEYLLFFLDYNKQMSEFLYSSRKQSDEQSFYALREKLEVIMKTLQTQKQQFQRQQLMKVKQYSQELKFKEREISQLRTELEKANKNASRAQAEAQNYRSIIYQLKREFFKMAEVVNKANVISEYQPQEQVTLKRVKSDLHENKFKKIQLHKSSTASQKSMKFDINGYFQKIKKESMGKGEEEDDRKTRQTTLEDNQSRLESCHSGDRQDRQFFFKETTNRLQKNRKLTKWASTMALPSEPEHLGNIRFRKSKQNQWQGTF